jgi:hypothetical protein
MGSFKEADVAVGVKVGVLVGVFVEVFVAVKVGVRVGVLVPIKYSIAPISQLPPCGRVVPC